MDFKDLEKKSNKELQKLLAEARTSFSELKFKVSAKQHKNVRELRGLRKHIARIMTLLSLGKSPE